MKANEYIGYTKSGYIETDIINPDRIYKLIELDYEGMSNDYVKAYDSLITSVDKKIVYNPTVTDVWFIEKGNTYCVRGGETLYL